MKKRSGSIPPHGSQTAQISCADSQTEIRELHGSPQQSVFSITGQVFSRTGS
jgi:hypothetical protein